MMSKCRATFLMLPLLCFLVSTIPTSCKPNTLVCNEEEKSALLTFKRALIDPANQLSSWSADHEDYCGWIGVHCHNISGHVTELHLSYFGLGGKVSPALLRLKFLKYLDLSSNEFGGAPIPSFLGSMRSLTHLDLSGASFGGLVPSQLGNLSNLHYLSLGGSFSGYLDNFHGLYVEDFSWISRLSSLQNLSMTDVDLHRDVHSFEYISMLSSLSTLELVGCGLDSLSPSLGYVNFTSLTILGISGHHFNHGIPNWLFNITPSSLQILDFNNNGLRGQIPEHLGIFHHLKFLILQSNSFDGPVPSSLGNLSSLTSLFINGNRLNGSLPSSLWLLSNLEFLCVEENLLAGTISEMHFQKLSKLRFIDMSSTSLSFKVKPNWVPPFQLEYLSVASCKIGPKFPTWLQTQKSLWRLDISMSGIVDIAPNWFWKWTSHAGLVDISGNQISGDLSAVCLNTTSIFLSSNCFTGRLPALSPNVIALTMDNNSFSGPISHFLCQKMNGKSQLQMLDLSNNHLSGELSPMCWKHWPSLTHVNLGSNNLSGKIPHSITSSSRLAALHLHNNSFSGTMPSSFRNCTSLGLLDLGGNKLFGNIPPWIGELTALRALRLRSNNFLGEIPSQICQLSSLIILDLADNNLSGMIPKCLNNFSIMAAMDTPDDNVSTAFTYSLYSLYKESLALMTVGREFQYKEILGYVRMVDLSSNNLSGPIPLQLSRLAGLRFLNLSRNHLVGRIPEDIGRMQSLLSLDLSTNHLSGEIPQSLTNLTFLSHLNLSYNNFWGRIPSGTQLQSFDALSYQGNAQLCGAPLPKNCTEGEESHHGANPVHEDEEGSEMPWFYMGMGVGFFVGFSGVWGVLVFKKAWRHAYFRFVDHIKDQVYVATVIRLKRFRNRLRGFGFGSTWLSWCKR